MLALLLLKGLSTFEYSLRDKEATYKEVFSNDFKTKEGFITKLRKGKESATDSLLLIDMGLSDAVAISRTIEGITVESQDTGYIELRYRSELHPITQAEIVWRNKENKKQLIQQINPVVDEFVVVNSELISFADFSEIAILLDNTGIQQGTQQDSLLSSQGPIELGILYIDYVKFIAELKQKPLF